MDKETKTSELINPEKKNHSLYLESLSYYHIFVEI